MEAGGIFDKIKEKVDFVEKIPWWGIWLMIIALFILFIMTIAYSAKARKAAGTATTAGVAKASMMGGGAPLMRTPLKYPTGSESDRVAYISGNTVPAAGPTTPGLFKTHLAGTAFSDR